MKHVYLSNRFGVDVYPRNVGGGFVNYLNEPLILPPQCSVGIHEIYYLPNGWYNVRSTNNTISMRISNVKKDDGTFTSHNMTTQIPPNQYVNGIALMQAIVNSINKVLYEYFRNSEAAGFYWKRDLGSPARDWWYNRQGGWKREQPYTYIDKTVNQNKPGSLQEWKDVEVIPGDWDPRRIADGRYIMGYYEDEHFILRRDYTNEYTLDIAFEDSISRLLGFSQLERQQLEWYAFQKARWNSIRAAYVPNMNAQTLNTIWVMCDVVELTDFGCGKQYPLLRVMPADTMRNHVSHNFGITQYRKVIGPRINSIRIWFVEDLSSNTVLDIYSDVYIRLEFKNG